MSTAVAQAVNIMTLGGLQQHRPLQQPSLHQSKKMIMMMDMQQHQQYQPANGTCVIVSAGSSPPHFTNLDSHMADHTITSTATTTIITTNTNANRTIITPNNNNNTKAKNNNNNNNTTNNLNKVNRSQGGAVQKTRPIAPASRETVLVTTGTSTTSAGSAADAMRCKRRIQFSGAQGQGQHLQFTGHQPASVARRNARERNRVKQVNNGFATLRSHIPASVAAALQESSGSSSSSERGGRSSKADKEAAKKLSKVETLRMAVEYIRSLQAMLAESGAGSENTAPLQVKTESVLSDSPNGFDADYETAIALSQYSAPQESMHQSHMSHSGHHQLLPGLTSMSPPCSDASSSPTPSYVSDGSVGASSTGYAPPMFRMAATTHMSQCRPNMDSPSTPPDTGIYEPMSPEDEELLDVISWWQQSN